MALNDFKSEGLPALGNLLRNGSLLEVPLWLLIAGGMPGTLLELVRNSPCGNHPRTDQSLGCEAWPPRGCQKACSGGGGDFKSSEL